MAEASERAGRLVAWQAHITSRRYIPSRRAKIALSPLELRRGVRIMAYLLWRLACIKHALRT